MASATTPLHRRGFRRLLAAQTISSIGDWLATFALMSLVLDISGSAAAVGGILALRFAPAAVAGLLIGRLAGRVGRRTLLVRLDLARAGVAALIPVVSSLWWVYSLALALELATVIAVAARDASIRDLVADEDLPVANGMILGATYGAIPIGAGAFAVTVALVDRLPGTLPELRTAPAFWLDAATFLVSALLIRLVVEIMDRPQSRVAAGGGLRLRFSWRIPVVRTTLLPIVAASIGIGTLFSLGVGFVRDTLGADEAQFGTLVALFGVGAAGGLALRQAGRLSGVRAVRIGVVAMGLVMVGMGFAGGLAIALVMAVLFGAGGALAIVSGLTVLEETPDPDMRLMALGAFHVAVRVALAAGALGAGLAVDLVGEATIAGIEGPRLVILVAGAVVGVSSLLVRGPGEPA